jgi:hypothetical protein
VNKKKKERNTSQIKRGRVTVKTKHEKLLGNKGVRCQVDKNKETDKTMSRGIK